MNEQCCCSGILKMVNVDTRNRFYNVIVLLNESGESILQVCTLPYGCKYLTDKDKDVPRVDGYI